MRKVTITLLALLLTVLGATSAFAQGSVSYAVGVQIKNLDNSNAANVTVTYYSQTDGSSAGSHSEAIPAGDSFTMATLQGVSTGFNGSAVVSSDRQIAAIANVIGNGTMGASYNAFSAGDTSASLPLLMRNNFGFNTWFNVQNTGSSSATVTINYSNGTSEDATIAAGAAKTFDQATNAALGETFVGSASVTSDQPIAVTVLQQGATTLLGYDGFRSADASTNPVMPLINANNFGFITGVQIQNTGTQSTDVTVSYTANPDSGSDCTETQTIAGGSSATFALGAFGSTSGSNETCANDATFVGSASVTANSASQPLVAIVNQLNTPANYGAAYNGFNPANGTSTVVMPLIMDRNFGFFTGFSVVNVGDSPANVSCSYSNSNVTSSETVAPGAALTVSNGGQLSEGYVGAATCTASGGSLVGIVNELLSGATTDFFLVYEGTNQ